MVVTHSFGTQCHGLWKNTSKPMPVCIVKDNKILLLFTICSPIIPLTRKFWQASNAKTCHNKHCLMLSGMSSTNSTQNWNCTTTSCPNFGPYNLCISRYFYTPIGVPAFVITNSRNKQKGDDAIWREHEPNNVSLYPTTFDNRHYMNATAFVHTVERHWITTQTSHWNTSFPSVKAEKMTSATMSLYVKPVTKKNPMTS